MLHFLFMMQRSAATFVFNFVRDISDWVCRFNGFLFVMFLSKTQARRGNQTNRCGTNMGKKFADTPTAMRDIYFLPRKSCKFLVNMLL